ncbi:hypothetical protein L7F22_001504 [Adiantum nelumboides]|nr:hypothetical protein [Adiantum nelumboides]
MRSLKRLREVNPREAERSSCMASKASSKISGGNHQTVGGISPLPIITNVQVCSGRWEREGREEHGLYKLRDSRTLSLYLSPSYVSELWHARFGHLNYDYLQLAFKDGLVTGLPEVGIPKHPCTSCIKGKQHWDLIPKKASRRASHQLELLHMDLCGPMRQVSLGGSEYFFLVIDDFSRMTWVHFLKHKSDVFVTFKEWMTMVELESGPRVKTIRADKGGEFTSLSLKKCAKKGIK